MAAHGRCVSCGYLGKRNQWDETTYYEVVAKDRELGTFLRHTRADAQAAQGDSMPHVETYIACFVHHANLLDELNIFAPGGAETHHLAVINKNRECGDWIEWDRGQSPKEHRERLRMLQLEQERRQFETKVTLWMATLAALQVAVAVAGILAAIWISRMPTAPLRVVVVTPQAGQG
jgi:hypothetical protein